MRRQGGLPSGFVSPAGGAAFLRTTVLNMVFSDSICQFSDRLCFERCLGNPPFLSNIQFLIRGDSND
jgi:hypothetical protein